MGLASKGTGPSFAEVLRSDSVFVAKELHIVGGHHSRMRVSLAKPCALNLLPAVRFVEEDPRSAVNCSYMESPPLQQRPALSSAGQEVSPLFEFEIRNFELAHVEQVGH